MSTAVAEGATATAPVERGWRWFVAALVVTIAISAIAAWPPTLSLTGSLVRMLLPVEQFVLLVLSATAACAVVGWWSGGGFPAPLFWIGLTGWVLWKAPFPSASYADFARGWAIILGASFALVSLAGGSQRFLTRAVGAVFLAGFVAFAGLSVRSAPGQGAMSAPSRMLALEYERRVDQSLAVWQRRASSPVWKAFAERMPEAAERAERTAAVLGVLGRPSGPAVGGQASLVLILAPAFLALESLLALALGWSAYHRLSRVRIGPPLGRVRSLSFSDQWVWGVVVGFTLLLLPTLVEWRPAGLNLLVFFGALYALRGTGVLLWWLSGRWGWVLPVGLAVLIPLLGSFRVITAFVLIAFGTGLSDTWRDLRRRAGAHGPAPRS